MKPLFSSLDTSIEIKTLDQLICCCTEDALLTLTKYFGLSKPNALTELLKTKMLIDYFQNHFLFKEQFLPILYNSKVVNGYNSITFEIKNIAIIKSTFSITPDILTQNQKQALKVYAAVKSQSSRFYTFFTPPQSVTIACWQLYIVFSQKDNSLFQSTIFLICTKLSCLCHWIKST